MVVDATARVIWMTSPCHQAALAVRRLQRIGARSCPPKYNCAPMPLCLMARVVEIMGAAHEAGAAAHRPMAEPAKTSAR